MKVLLLGDASNYHATLARALTALGHDVTLASDGCRWMHTASDIDVSRHESIFGGALLYARLSTVLASRLKGYDVVQLSSPGFVDLRPIRLRKLFDRLRSDNGAVYLTSLGTDSTFVRNLTGPTPALGYSEWQVEQWTQSPKAEMHRWLKPHLCRYTDDVYNSVNGVVSALYEYHKVVEAEYSAVPLVYGGIPIDIESLPAKRQHPTGDKMRILYACHKGREIEKGADRLLTLLKRLKAEYPDKVELVMPLNMPFDDFVRTLASVDIVCDQLYSYTPATTALMAMAMGVVPISGGENEYYRFIGERDGIRPIINPDPFDLESTYSLLVELTTHPDDLRAMCNVAPAFVKRHNDSQLVASRFLKAWGV